MRLGTEMRATVWTLLGLQLCTAAGAIVLFTRMAPAIQNIIEENVASLRAVVQMQQALASTDSDRTQRFEQALAQAEGNVTEEAERPVLRRLRRRHAAALAGDNTRRRQTLTALEQLVAINFSAMERSDRQASRLGQAGAWAMAVLGMICFVVSIWAVRKVARQVTLPLTQIHQTVTAFRGGDTRRRCAIHDAALEATEIGQAVDQLLDVAERRSSPLGSGAVDDGPARAVLLALLADHDRPTLVVSRPGEVIAANAAALELLGQQATLKQQVLDRLLQPGEEQAAGADPVSEARPVGDQAWIVHLAG
jgi:hypothetical protein